MNKIKLYKLIEEYKEKWSLYNDFCITMKNLLVYLLEDRKYKYQISYRIKSIDSLTKKMLKNVAEGKKCKKLSDIEDLAGIRIVFYLQSDKKRFITDLFKEFMPHKLKLEERHKKKVTGRPMQRQNSAGKD
jgi:ppGpp synthetase/RelA/SpoT-type nucleotidyltranferase